MILKNILRLLCCLRWKNPLGRSLSDALPAAQKDAAVFFPSYERSIVDVVDGQISDQRYEIMRVRCSCGATHAILPDFIVPYSVYSLPCILYILRIYFTHSMTIEEICNQFEIAYSTLYRWKAAFATHKLWWLGFVRADKTPALAFLDDLLGRDPFSGFTMDFHRRTLYSFLQTHANPSNCCQAVPGWPESGDTGT